MATFNISDDTKATARGFTEKFGSRKKDKQNNKEKATNKAKDINSVYSTANKLVPLKQGNEFLDILMKVYGFMKKTHDNDILRLQKQNNYREEKDFEDAIRHKKLMDALAALQFNLGSTTTTIDSTGGFEPPYIPRFFDRKPGTGGSNRAPKGAGGKESKQKGNSKKIIQYRNAKGQIQKAPTATKISKTLTGAKKLLGNLKGIPLLSIIPAGFTMITNIEQAVKDNEEGNIDDKELKKIIVKEIAAALAGIGGAEIGAVMGSAFGPIGAIGGGIIGFTLGQYVGAEAAEKLFDYYTGDKAVNVSEVKPKATLTTPVNKVKEIEPEPASIPQTKSIPVSVTPTGDRFNRAQSENNTVKIDGDSQPSVSTINNVIANSGRTNTVMPSVAVPSVRNSETTFQDMIYYSTRVV